MRILYLILARGGSTRVPGKNIAMVGHLPLVAYAISSARRCCYKGRIVVSTNCARIAKAAKIHGAETIKRPESISGPASTEYAAVVHALDFLKGNEGYDPDIVVKLFPTAPFRKPSSIRKCIDLLLSNHPFCDSVRAVRLVKEHPYKMWSIRSGRLHRFIKTKKESHTLAYQSLPTLYVNAASIDVTWTSTIRKHFSVTGKTIVPYIMSEEEAFDINTKQDLKIARMLVRGK